MIKKIGQIIKRAYRVSLQPGYLYLTADDERVGEYLPAGFGYSWVGIMLISLAWGLVSIGIWEGALRLFDWYSYDFPLMSVALTLIVMVMWIYRRAVIALGEVVVGGDPAAKALGGCVITLAFALGLLGVKGWNEDWPTYLPVMWQWTRPRALYRVLLLMPLWGGWAMLALPQFFRPSEQTDPATKSLAAGCESLVATAFLAAILAGTVLYFNYLPWTQLSIPAATVFVALGGGWLVVRRTGGLNRRALLAVNILTQLIFLFAYLANRT